MIWVRGLLRNAEATPCPPSTAPSTKHQALQHTTSTLQAHPAHQALLRLHHHCHRLSSIRKLQTWLCNLFYFCALYWPLVPSFVIDFKHSLPTLFCIFENHSNHRCHYLSLMCKLLFPTYVRFIDQQYHCLSSITKSKPICFLNRGRAQITLTFG